MITNCYKVEELKQTREEIDGVHQALRQFQNNLEIIQEFEIRCDRLESDFHSEIFRLRKDLAPNQQKQLNVNTKIESLLNFQKEYKNDQQIKDSRISNIETQFLDHQQKIQKILLNEFTESAQKIVNLEKQIQKINNISQESHVFFQKCKDQFEEVNKQILQQEIEIINLKMDLKEKFQEKIEQIFKNCLNNNTQIIDLSDKFIEIKASISDILTQISQQNSKFSEIQQFLIYQQPIVTQLQISDLFQEFLCIPDQMKLIEYDNHKFAQLKMFQSQKSFTQNSLNLSLPQNQKNTSCIQLFNQNIQSFLNVILTEQSGAVRINFQKDISPEISHLQKRTKEITQDLKLKASLTKRIYKFEKQVFIIQGKIKGQIVQTQDLLEEVHSRDKHDYIDGRKYDELAQSNSLINLNDPNHKLKQQIKFIDKDHLIQLYLENDRITRKKHEEYMLANQQIVKNIQEEMNQQNNEQALQNRRQTRRNNNRQMQQSGENSLDSSNQIIQPNNLLTLSNNIQIPIFAQQAQFDPNNFLLPMIKSQANDNKKNEMSSNETKHEKSGSNYSQKILNYQMKMQQNQLQQQQNSQKTNIQQQELEQLNLTMGLLQNVKITVNPDFHLLPETNICSRCAFKGQILDVVKNNNHILNIAPPRQVIYEMIFVKSEKKINKIHHRFLSKKRNWLTRQIDPAKRYLYMIEKNARINKINSEGEIDLDAENSQETSKNIIEDQSIDIDIQIDEQKLKTAEQVQENHEDDKKDTNIIWSAEKKKKNINLSATSQAQDNEEKPKSAVPSENIIIQRMRSKGPSLSIVQQLIQSELQKMKTVIEVQMQTKMSLFNTTIMSKIQSCNNRLDIQGNSLAEFKHVTNKAIIKQYETSEKRMQSIELNQEYIEDQFKQKTKEYEDLIDKQEQHIVEFKDYINHELIQFYKNKKRVQTEIQSHARDYKTKFKVLADLNEEFSFKLSYIDKMLPIIVEQNKFTYSLLLQDIVNRQKLTESLKSQQIQNNGYLLLEKLRCFKNQQNEQEEDQLKELLVQIQIMLQGQQEQDKRITQSQNQSNLESSSRIKDQQQQNKIDLSNLNQLPGKFIEKQLKNSQGGLYLEVMKFRNQFIYFSKIETYLEKMNEKLEILMDNVKPYNNFWEKKEKNIDEINIQSSYQNQSINENEDQIQQNVIKNGVEIKNIMMKNTKEELMLKRRKIFDDIHLGKLSEFIKDAYFIQKLDLNKICLLVSQQELDQTNLTDKFLKDYLNEVQVGNEESSQDMYPNENLSLQQRQIRNILSIRAASAGQLLNSNVSYKKAEYQLKESNKDLSDINYNSAQITNQNKTTYTQKTINGQRQTNNILTSHQSKTITNYQQSTSKINIQTMQRNTPEYRKNNIVIQNNKTSEMNTPVEKVSSKKDSSFLLNQKSSELLYQQKQENYQNMKIQNKIDKKSISSQQIIIKQPKQFDQNKIDNTIISKLQKNSKSVINLDRKTDSIINQDFERSQKLLTELSNSNALRIGSQNDIHRNNKQTLVVAKMLNGSVQPIHTNTDILQIAQNNLQLSNQKQSFRSAKQNFIQSAVQIENNNNGQKIQGQQDLMQYLNSSNLYNINRNKHNQTLLNESSSKIGMISDINNYQSQNQFKNHSLLQRNIPLNKRELANTTITNQQINSVNSQLQHHLNIKNQQL